MLISALLDTITEALIEQIVEVSGDKIKPFLSKDPRKKAIKKALGTAVEKYIKGADSSIYQPLLEKDGLLMDIDVINEFAKILSFNNRTNKQIIVDKWSAKLDRISEDINLSNEVEIILKYFENELRDVEIFRTVFQSKSLNDIQLNTFEMVESLNSIEENFELLNNRYGELLNAFVISPYLIANNIHNFTQYIEEKVKDFIGRQFIFHSINNFINNNSLGYFFLRGDPGIGKSAIAAQLVKINGYLHHFNIRSSGINKASDFLKNICAQLIATYKLNYKSFPPDALTNGLFLDKLLKEVSDKLGHEKCIIVVDALDEVESNYLTIDSNILYLPRILPKGIYFIVTTRREELPLRIDINECMDFSIEQDDPENLLDIRSYINSQIFLPGIQKYIQNQNINNELFIQELVTRSQGNFIYLRMIIPELILGSYSNINLLPVGLTSYYEDHWRRIRKKSELDWFNYKLPIILALTVVKEPISINQIAEFSSISNRRYILAILKDFDQFIFIDKIKNESDIEKRYRWYHASFFEFIASKDSIADERIDLINANKIIVDRMWSKLFDI